jgi:hypothetical protein
MSLRTPILGALLLLLMVGAPAAAQEPGAAPPPDTTQNAALRAFLDCDERGCDRDFLVTELKWINFMRDRLDADFHILVTSQQTGSGGRQYAVVAIGQRAFAGKVDTLNFITNPNDANDLIRRQLLRVIGQLLLPHAAQGPLGSRLTIAYAAPTGATSASTTAARDRWNFWTYSISANGFLNGESRQSFRNGWTNFSANRTTEAWMVRLNANASYDESKFTFELQPGTDTTIVALQRSSGFSGMAVKSINDHWSAGGRASVERSDFQNLDLGSQAAAAIEWNFYPYQDFARRKLALLYTIGVRNNQYKEITIYDRLSETRPMHTFDATLGARQPWGQANVTLYGRQFLDEFKYYSAGATRPRTLVQRGRFHLAGARPAVPRARRRVAERGAHAAPRAADQLPVLHVLRDPLPVRVDLQLGGESAVREHRRGE